MNLQHRKALLQRLGQYILSDEPAWQDACARASQENGWFTPEFIRLASSAISNEYLQPTALDPWIEPYTKRLEHITPSSVGIIMAGNIPLVGFHDFLCTFIAGHRAVIKPSPRDNVLIRHIAGVMTKWDAAVAAQVSFADMLKGCDAYIATGSNNSSRYFEHYFGKYPSIIRRNRTSIAVLDGNETPAELETLTDDVCLFFGLGCRNVTKLLVPAGYDFIPLINALHKYDYFADHHKYKNNFDYNLAIHLLNNQYYMTNGSVLVVEDAAIFSPISQLNYEYYRDGDHLSAMIPPAQDLQCIVGHFKGALPFGEAQHPAIDDYADGINTMEFLASLK